ncbi:DM13 domain-containing protein [Vibrio sp. WXL103]|uniref:DM13 domain-containing protein n=1 Tax=unclassified Vibrio TaxID=2614977 RepID=UPI003EC618F9
MRLLGFTLSHLIALAIGFGLGVYALPILIAPESPPESAISAVQAKAQYTAKFDKDRQDSDFLHWGEGVVAVANDSISFVGELAPGPDYKAYLSPEFIETEAEFQRLKPLMVQVGDVKTFNQFMLSINEDIDINQYNTVIIWCESFGQFITSGQYR